ncbi:hypothetical protein VH569_31890 [Azospirillum sp. 11R-A]|uniref:hypothetical protein n=1 Tax=Azospirillum sp. 11R-A TaxID=3111634 RepID=UPI003C14F45C
MEHGFLTCRRCFEGTETERTTGLFAMHNNPGYWGAPDPLVLVLGFSKGRNQIRALKTQPFHAVAFAGLRERLGEILAAVGVMPPGTGMDALMTAAERDFGFASLVRCTVWLSGRTSGGITVATFRDPIMRDCAARCIETFLGDLPPRLRLVVLLGTTFNYVAEVKAVFRSLHGNSYRDSGALSFEVDGRTYVFAMSPSRSTGSHHRPYVERPVHPTRDAVRHAVRRSGVPELLAPRWANGS